MKHIIVITGFIFILFSAGNAFALHPLITDDAGTMGKGKAQIETGGQYSYDKEHIEDGVTRKIQGGQVSATLTYGLVDGVDLVLGIPYLWSKTREDDAVTFRTDGFSDVSFDLKWRFHEIDGWGFALKPGITVPTGDDDRELGTGGVSYRLYGIVTKEMEPWAFHMNIGYARNENTLEQEKNLWHASIAAEVEMVKSLKAVADFSLDRNTTKGSDTPLTYVIGGLVYALSEKVSIDGGVKIGLTRPSVDITYLLGLTMKF